jgi:hypothetical protein
MNATGSVTRWLQQLQGGDAGASDQAAQDIWQRYAARLLALARHNLGRRLRQRVDEEDVLQSMYKSFCVRQRRGEFDLAGRDELWRLLATVTLRKVRNLAKFHARARRDYRREEGARPGPLDSQAPQEPCDRLADAAPTPEEAAALNEDLRRYLQALPPELRRVALWKLEGHTNEEIAGPGLLNCALRTVERKVERIRGKWLRLASPDGPEGPSPPVRP